MCVDRRGEAGWADATGSHFSGSRCHVGPADPRCSSAGCISEAKFEFSSASPVSGHRAFGFSPLQPVQIPQEKVKGPLDRTAGRLADGWPWRSRVLFRFLSVQGSPASILCGFGSCCSILVPVWCYKTIIKNH